MKRGCRLKKCMTTCWTLPISIPFKLLILPNIAALSDQQCQQLKEYVRRGGSLLATFETSLYDEWGVPRKDFGLAELLGVSWKGKREGPMQNSYLGLNPDPATGKFHPVLAGLEDATRIINGVWRLDVEPHGEFPSPVTLIPSYPDLPMEDVFPRIPRTQTRELYLREIGKSRIVYFPWDIDRTFWEVLSLDHAQAAAQRHRVGDERRKTSHGNRTRESWMSPCGVRRNL